MDASASLSSPAREPSPSPPELRLLDSGPPLTSRAPAWALQNVDAARAVATWGVIWVHVAEMQGLSSNIAALGRFGTSFYVIVLALLGVRAGLSRPDRTVREELQRGAQRLLVPFLLWSVIYGLSYGYHARQAGVGLRQLSLWWGPFAGTARHLWFLPFAFAAGLLVQWLVGRVRTWPRARLLRWTILGSAASYAFFYCFVYFVVPRALVVDLHLHRLDRWVEELPLLLLASGASLLVLQKPPRPSLLVAGLALAAFGALEFVYGRWGLWFADHTHHVDARYLSHAAGMAFFVLCVALPAPAWAKPVSKLRSVTYFVFLSHLFLLELVGGWLYHLPGFGTLGFALLSSLALFAIAAGLGALLRRIPGLSRLTG